MDLSHNQFLYYLQGHESIVTGSNFNLRKWKKLCESISRIKSLCVLDLTDTFLDDRGNKIKDEELIKNQTFSVLCDFGFQKKENEDIFVRG